MDSGFPQPDVDLTPDIVAGAALLAPAFGEDLSTWRMTIARDGTVLQELYPTHHGILVDSVCIHLQSFVSEDRIAQIQSVAREIDFASFKSEYHAVRTDGQNTSITLNCDGKAKRVAAYDPHGLAHDGNVDMIGYIRLWDMMLEVSPYRRTVATRLPKKGMRQRLQFLFERWL